MLLILAVDLEVVMNQNQASGMGAVMVFVGIVVLLLAWVVFPGMGIQGVGTAHPDLSLAFTQTYGSFVSLMFIVLGGIFLFG